MARVFIIHGAFGNQDENWLPWLKSELERIGCEVFVPQFPTPEGQNLGNWMKIFGKYAKLVDKDTILVGHSLGVPFLLNVLDRMDGEIRAAFFVAGFANPLGNARFDKTNATFVARDFNWVKIKQNCGKFYVFQSDNDPYVHSHMGREIADRLGAKLITVEGAGHFNENAGYTKFELLLETIKKEL